MGKDSKMHFEQPINTTKNYKATLKLQSTDFTNATDIQLLLLKVLSIPKLMISLLCGLNKSSLIIKCYSKHLQHSLHLLNANN